MYYYFQCNNGHAHVSWVGETIFYRCSKCGRDCIGKITASKSDDYRLKILSWNIERLGSTDSALGVPERRPDEIISAIATLIKTADPDVCAVIEVMEGKGDVEMGRIADELGDQWEWEMPSNGFRIGESYGLFLKKSSGIKIESFQLVEKDADGAPLFFPTNKYRPPAEAVLRMQDGWLMPVVIFHAPGPRADLERQEAIETAIANLGKVKTLKEKETYPDAFVCADFNANEEALNLVEEPKEFYEYGEHYLSALYLLHATEETTGKTALEISLSDWREVVAQEVPKIVDAKSVWLKELSETLDIHMKRPQIKAWEEKLDLLFKSEAPHHDLDGLPPTEEDLQYWEYREEYEGVFGTLYLEEARQLLFFLRAKKSALSDVEKSFKKDAIQVWREAKDIQRIAQRDEAWEPLTSLDFMNDLDYDSTMLTTRRKYIWTALKGDGEHADYIYFPEESDDLSASYYDQLMPRCNRFLSQPRAQVIPLLLAVASFGELTTLFGAPPVSPWRTMLYNDVKTLNTYSKATGLIQKKLEGEQAKLKRFIVGQALLARAKKISDHDPVLLTVKAKKASVGFTTHWTFSQ